MRLSALLGASFFLVSALAHAGDVVVLKDGTILEGTVGEMVPNQSITITVEGKARTIAWQDVERVNIDRAKAAPQAPAARTMLHVEGVDSDAFVQMLDQHGTTAWAEVCKGSCDHELPSDGLYRIVGSGIRASQPFRIEGAQANLHAKTASSVGFVGGLSMVILGGLSVVNGISFFVLAELDKDVLTSGTYRDFYIAGGVLTGVGLGLLVGGAFLLGGNLRTKVTGATTVRVPAWRDAPPASSGLRVATFTFPAISGSF